MKTLVLYQSKTGNTEKYANDIAKRVNADIFPLKRFKAKKLSEYDTIVFGGWVKGGKIQGIDEFLSLNHIVRNRNDHKENRGHEQKLKGNRSDFSKGAQNVSVLVTDKKQLAHVGPYYRIGRKNQNGHLGERLKNVKGALP